VAETLAGPQVMDALMVRRVIVWHALVRVGMLTRDMATSEDLRGHATPAAAVGA
jgi:hypothetical protein